MKHRIRLRIMITLFYALSAWIFAMEARIFTDSNGNLSDAFWFCACAFVLGAFAELLEKP